MDSWDQEEQSLIVDPRFGEAVRLFNAGEWYDCHDRFEELWHETQGQSRRALQGILQIAVAHHHLNRGNQHGATVLMGEGLGRLQPFGTEQFGLDLVLLRQQTMARLQALQHGDAEACRALPQPRLQRVHS